MVNIFCNIAKFRLMLIFFSFFVKFIDIEKNDVPTQLSLNKHKNQTVPKWLSFKCIQWLL